MLIVLNSIFIYKLQTFLLENTTFKTIFSIGETFFIIEGWYFKPLQKNISSFAIDFYTNNKNKFLEEIWQNYKIILNKKNCDVISFFFNNVLKACLCYKI